MFLWKLSMNMHRSKKKILRFNDNPFMTKSLRKAIMHRSKVKNIYNQTRAIEEWDNYKKQKLLCIFFALLERINFKN